MLQVMAVLLSRSPTENNDKKKQSPRQPAMDIEYEQEINLYFLKPLGFGLFVTVTHPRLS